MNEVYDINALSQVCGYFTGNTEICGGYGCSHPDNDDTEMMITDGEGRARYAAAEEIRDNPSVFSQGRCLACSCPLGHLCQLEDLKEYDRETYDEIVREKSRQELQGT